MSPSNNPLDVTTDNHSQRQIKAKSTIDEANEVQSVERTSAALSYSHFGCSGFRSEPVEIAAFARSERVAINYEFEGAKHKDVVLVSELEFLQEDARQSVVALWIVPHESSSDAAVEALSGQQVYLFRAVARFLNSVPDPLGIFAVPTRRFSSDVHPEKVPHEFSLVLTPHTVGLDDAFGKVVSQVKRLNDAADPLVISIKKSAPTLVGESDTIVQQLGYFRPQDIPYRGQSELSTKELALSTSVAADKIVVFLLTTLASKLSEREIAKTLTLTEALSTVLSANTFDVSQTTDQLVKIIGSHFTSIGQQRLAEENASEVRAFIDSVASRVEKKQAAPKKKHFFMST